MKQVNHLALAVAIIASSLAAHAQSAIANNSTPVVAAKTAVAEGAQPVGGGKAQQALANQRDESMNTVTPPRKSDRGSLSSPGTASQGKPRVADANDTFCAPLSCQVTFPYFPI